MRIAGTSDVALQLDPVTIDGGMAYSVFAIGSAAAEPLGGNELQALIAVDPTMLPDTATADDAAAGAPALLIAVLVGLAALAFTIPLVSRRRLATER